MRVVVAGGLDYSDELKLERWMDYFLDRDGFNLVVTSDESGVGRLTKAWAAKRQITYIAKEPALTEGSRARSEINANLLSYNPNVVIVFPGGDECRNMMEQAKRCGVRIIEIC